MRVVVVGTGTSIGKTHVTAALLLRWLEAGGDAVALKPVESGVGAGTEGDQAVLARIGMLHVKHSATAEDVAASTGRGVEPGAPRPRAGSAALDFEGSAGLPSAELFHVKQGSPAKLPDRGLYSYSPAISPHLAARATGTTIEVPAITRWVEAHTAAVTIVETAGGLFSPLSRTADNLDLARALAPAYVLLVVPDRLGALHETRAASELAERRGLAIHGIVLSAPDHSDASTRSNGDELRWLGFGQTIVEFPRAPFDAPETSAQAAVIVSDVEDHWARRREGT